MNNIDNRNLYNVNSILNKKIDGDEVILSLPLFVKKDAVYAEMQATFKIKNAQSVIKKILLNEEMIENMKNKITYIMNNKFLYGKDDEVDDNVIIIDSLVEKELNYSFTIASLWISQIMYDYIYSLNKNK